MNAKVVVIGGGATGCGVARDLVLRGFDVTLVEHHNLGSGSSARFHGMLQSGARYAVSDPRYAAECSRERDIVTRIAPQAVQPVGGLFVVLPDDPLDYVERFVAGCTEAGIACEEQDPSRVMTEEPAISRDVQSAFAVPDATVNPWALVNLLADDVRRRGGHILIRHGVETIDIANGVVGTVKLSCEEGDLTLETDVVVNAAGPWSDRVAGLAGQSIAMELTKGAIMAFDGQLVGRAVNRCRPAGDNDIIVPTGEVSLFGTTAQVVDDPDDNEVSSSDVRALLEGAEILLPGAGSYPVRRVWAGIRPLVRPGDWPADEPTPRRHCVINHAEHGVAGFFTVSGGSLTTHRSMAEDVSDQICNHLGINRPCLTASTPLGETSAAPWPTLGSDQDN